MVQSFAKTVAVVAGAMFFSTLAVNALDMRGYLAQSLLGMVFFGQSEDTGPCPVHMVLVDTALEPFCIDQYEVSAGKDCPYADPASINETALNIADKDCAPVSEQRRVPWRHISAIDSEQVCSRAGKRLPTAGEWYKAALGTRDPAGAYQSDECNVASNRADGVAPTGNGLRCVSDVGAYDMIGNVWEWVGEEVVDGAWQGGALPASGYVSGADLYGVAFETGTIPNDTFHGDRFWSDFTVRAGMMRGGYYNSGGSAGIFSIYAASPRTFTGDAVGFRCVSAVRERGN